MKKSCLVILAMFLWVGTALAIVGGGDVRIKGGVSGDVIFSHNLHVGTAGLECTACHTKLYVDSKQHKPVTMKQMGKGKSCGACHDHSLLKHCEKCHLK